NTMTGAISGTPTAPGSFSVKVTDSTGAVATTTCPFLINPSVSLTCPPAGNLTGEVGVFFNSPAMTVTGGTAPLTFSVIGTLPAVPTINTSTGAISGTPSAAGTFSVKVTDSLGAVATTTCPFVINPPISLTCPPSGSSTGTVGVPFSSPAMTVTGGTAPFT